MDSQNTHPTSPTISTKPVLVIAGVMFATLLAGNFFFGSLRDAIRDDVQSNLVSVGKLKASQIAYWLKDRLDDSKVFSENSFFSREVMQWMREGKRNDAWRLCLIERMKGFLIGKGLRSIVLYDASGRVILWAGDNSDEGVLTAAAREVAASGETRFVDLHRHHDALFSIDMGFLSPLREGDRNFGAVYLSEDPENYLYPLIHAWPTRSRAAETKLVRKEGDDVLFLDKFRHREGTPLTVRMPLDTPKLAAAMALRGKLDDANDYRGVPVLSFATAISGTPWILISKIDEDEAYGMINRVRGVTAILALIICSLIGAWFWQWRRREQAALEAVVLQERVRADFLQMEGEKHFRMVFEHTALPMVRNALNGEFIEVNDAWCEMFGYSGEEAASQHLSWQQITHPEDLDVGSVLVKKLLDGEINKFHVEKRYLRKDGKVLWGILQVTLVQDDQGAPQYFISAIHDITERKQLERDLEDNLSILKMAQEGAQEAVWEWDLVSGKTKFSPQYYTMLGYEPDEFSADQDEWLARIHPDERDIVIGKIREDMAQGQDMHITEYRMRAKDGRYRWIQGRGKVVSFDASGKPVRMVGINTDITERKQFEQQISFMAYHDKLTGLPNRALLFDRLSQAMSQARRDSKHVVLLFVDLDGFKEVNDQCGHEAGDAVLKMSAQRFMACVRAVDTVSRFGGDEFAIILGNLDEPQLAKSVAEKIVQAFAYSMVLADGVECTVGVSVGISIYPEHGSAMDSLLVAADHAMYESKRKGRNSYTFYNEAMPVRENTQWLKLEACHIGGVREIDEQHANLVYLVNRLNDALKRNDSPESVMQMLEELLVATTHHFETESRYMTNFHYPDQAEHEKEHAKLVNDALLMKSQFGQGRELLVLQSVKDWLLDHIAYLDKKMAIYLVQHGAK